MAVFDEAAPFCAEIGIGIHAAHILTKITKFNLNVRAFSPKFSVIKDKRFQLHDVIRLSGINIIFDDMDHLLTVKATSIPRARVQIYFIEDTELLNRHGPLGENGVFYPDIHERIMFFIKSVIKCIEKIMWVPQYLHVGGIMSAFVPVIINKLRGQIPHFTQHLKIRVSVAEMNYDGEVSTEILRFLKEEDVDYDLSEFLPLNYENIMRMVIKFSDAVLFHDQQSYQRFIDYTKKLKKEFYVVPDLMNHNYDVELFLLLEKLGYVELPDEYHPERILSRTKATG